METETFWVGSEACPEPRHIGSIVLVDLYILNDYSESMFTLHSYVGTLKGFTESRGSFRYDEDDDDENPDLSVHTDYSVQFFLDEGRVFRMREKDKAQMTIYPPKEV